MCMHINIFAYKHAHTHIHMLEGSKSIYFECKWIIFGILEYSLIYTDLQNSGEFDENTDLFFII